MTGTFARGACPRLAAPMATGDGLLARMVPAGPIGIDAFAALCAAAQTYGNGLMEISARGSLQVRGLNPDSAPLFACANRFLHREAVAQASCPQIKLGKQTRCLCYDLLAQWSQNLCEATAGGPRLPLALHVQAESL